MRSLSLSLIPVVILCFLPAAGVAAPSKLPSIEGSLSKWHSGQRMQVALKSGGKLMGNLGEVHADSFVLLPDKRAGASRDLRFDEVRSVQKKWAKSTKWIMSFAIYFGLVGLGAAL